MVDQKALKSAQNVNMAEPKKSELDSEWGVSASFPVSSWDSFSYGKNFGTAKGGYLLNRDAEAVPVQELVRMRRRDGQTRSLQRLFVLPILACLKEAEWVAPPDVEGSEKEVEFANLMWNLPASQGGMTVSKRDVLKQTLLALVEGFSAFEVVTRYIEDGPLKGKYTIRKLAHRDSRTIQFKVDETGGFNGIRQVARRPDGESIDVTIPKERCLFYTCNGEEAPFYGVSMFESSWYHYDVKSKLYYVAHMASQLAAVPGRVGTYPLSATPAQKNAFRKALGDFAMNTSMTVPQGFTVTPFNSNSGFDFIRLIDHHSHLQAKSVLLQFADSDNRLAIIDNGGQDASADMFVQALQSIMDEIAEIWSIHLMPRYIDWNFNSGKYPVFRFGPIADSAKDAVKEVFSSIVTSSVLNCTPEFMRQAEEKLATRLGFDIDYAEIRKKEEEAAEKAAQIAEEQAKSAEQGGPTTDLGGAPGIGDTSQAAQVEQAADTSQSSDDAPAEEPPPEEKNSEDVAAMSAQSSIDDIVNMAQKLFESRPDYPYDGDV